MEEIYRLNNFEPIGEDLANKLLTNYWFFKIIIYFDKIINVNDIDNVSISIFKNNNGVIMYVVDNLFYYYNNQLEVKIMPIKPFKEFIKKYITNESHIRINILSDNINKIECHIKLCQNISLNYHKFPKIPFLNNHFKDEIEFKNYIMLFTKMNDEQYEKWYIEFRNEYQNYYLDNL
jgi:hypothetical protein